MEIQHSIHKNLSHLSKADLEDVIQLYENGVKVAEIAALYNIELLHGSLAPLLPPKILDEECPHCHIPLQQQISRDAKPIPYCPECQHTSSPSCKCSNCLNVIDERRKSVRQTVLDLQSHPPQKPTSLLHWLYQKALLKGHIGNGVIKPIDRMNDKLTPDNLILDDVQLAQTLYAHGIITVSEKSPLSAFPNECEVPSFYIKQVFFNTNADNSPPEYTREELEGLRKFIVASEVVEYISYQIDKVGHAYHHSDVVEDAVYTMLEDFTPAQMFSIIWSSVNYATRCYSEGWLKRKDFTSHLMKSCKRYATRAQTEGWEVKSFNRPKSLPQSVISRVIDDVCGKSCFNR